MPVKNKLMLILTLMLSGRAMTLAFIHRAGGPGPGDPPAAWLMPLIGDAVIGLTGLLVAYLVLSRKGQLVWTAIVTWNVVAVWDAMSAYVVHLSNPWPDFFMIQIFGASMFFIASAMHIIIIYLAMSSEVRSHYE